MPARRVLWQRVRASLGSGYSLGRSGGRGNGGLYGAGMGGGAAVWMVGGRALPLALLSQKVVDVSQKVVDAQLWSVFCYIKQDRIWPDLCYISHCDCCRTGPKFFSNHSARTAPQGSGQAGA